MNEEIKKLQDELGFIEEHAKNMLEYLAYFEKNRKLTVAEEKIRNEILQIRNLSANAMIYLDIESNGNPWD